MNTSGDAAEQVVRLSLEGFEVAAKLTGSAAKNIAILLMAALKEEGKTQGKARLTNMIRSGKELKVFSIPQRDLKSLRNTQRNMVCFTRYCVISIAKIQTLLLILSPVPRMLPRFREL